MITAELCVPHPARSLLLTPGIGFLAQRERDGSWSVQFAGFNATELQDWPALEAFIWEMMEY